MHGKAVLTVTAALTASVLVFVLLPVLADSVPVVSQKGREFDPKSISVSRGTVVRFLNDDEFTHHVYIKTPEYNFDAGEIDIGEYAEARLDVAGEFTARCAIHPKMRLDIEVK